MNKNIEVEGGEIAIRNSHGDLAIIPKDKRNWVKQKLSEGCHSCIDSLVETLPVASQYAQDGSVYPPNTKVKVNQDNQIKEYDINSPEYKDLYNSGRLMSYDKNTDTYIAPPLKEVTITAEAPQWLKYKREYEKNNPKSEYINQYLNPFARSLGNTETNYPKRLDNEYEEKSLDYASEQLVKNKPQGKLSREEWLNQMSDKEEELIKRNPKYQSSLWADTKRGLTSLVEQNPLQTFQNILNSSDYTNREKQEMLKDYANHPVMSKLGDAAKILNPLTVPSKMVQSAYKKDYSLKDALKGKKNNAGIVEDIVTDPLNLVGLGIWNKLKYANKFKNLDEVYESVKGLSKEVQIEKLTEEAGRFDHNLKNNPNLAWRDEGDGLLRPYNTKSGKLLQEEYIDNIKSYYNSPEFKRIMEEHYPDINIETYKQKTLQNLESPITYNPKETGNNLGVYKTKQSSDAAYIPGHTPTFKQKVNNANTNKYFSNDRGKSYLKVFDATDHELSHQRTNGDELLPNFLTDDFLKKNVKPEINDELEMVKDLGENSIQYDNFKYQTKPTEFEVRLRQLKEDIKSNGINDYFNKPITEEHINKLLKPELEQTKQETDLFTTFNKNYREAKNKGIKDVELQKIKDKYFEDLDKIKVEQHNISDDSKDLLKYYTPKFLSDMANKLPAVIPFYLYLNNQNESK